MFRNEISNIPEMLIDSDHIIFSGSAIKDLSVFLTEYIQVFINPVEKKILILPSAEEIADSIHWCDSEGNPLKVKSGKFSRALYGNAGWGIDKAYRIPKDKNTDLMEGLVFDFGKAKVISDNWVLEIIKTITGYWRMKKGEVSKCQEIPQGAVLYPKM